MNIESMPGGRQALEDMYNNIQAPMQEALSGSRRPQEDDTVVPELDTESGPRGDSIPNPWAQNQSENNAPSTPAPFRYPMDMSSMLSGMLGQGRGQAPSAQNNSANSIWGQSGSNQSPIFQMMENPAVQSMMQTMMQNPELMRNMMSSMGAPANLRAMMNPASVPQAVPSPPQANAAARPQANVPAADSSPTAASTDSASNQNSAPAQAPPVANVPQPAAAIPQANPAAVNPLAALLGPMMAPAAQQPNLNQMRNPNPLLAFLNAQNVNAAQQSPQQPVVLTEAQAREMYASQLTQLRAMGFHDEARNLRALRETAGSVEASLDRLFRF